MVKKYKDWIILLLLDWDGPASYEELRNTMTAQGARPHSGDIKESCEELTRQAVLE